jgi:outer membrane protein assembly factor BamB
VFVAERPRTDPTVAAFGTASGDRQWTVDVPGDRPPGRPAVCDTHVFVGGDHLTAVDRETGVIDWQRELNVGTLAVAGETLYVTTWEPGGTSTTDAVFAFRGRSGERRWRYDGLEPASIWKIGTITDAGPVVGLGDRLVRFGPESVGVDEFPVLAAAAALGGAGLVAYLWRRSR